MSSLAKTITTFGLIVLNLVASFFLIGGTWPLEKGWTYDKETVLKLGLAIYLIVFAIIDLAIKIRAYVKDDSELHDASFWTAVVTTGLAFLAVFGKNIYESFSKSTIIIV